jgi:hypothetical protein
MIAIGMSAGWSFGIMTIPARTIGGSIRPADGREKKFVT